MIVRLIVFIAIFFIGWWLYRQFVVFKGQQTSSKDKNSKQQDKSQADQESMVRCLQCKTYVPRSHAIHDEQARPFCSAEHLKEFNQTN